MLAFVFSPKQISVATSCFPIFLAISSHFNFPLSVITSRNSLCMDSDKWTLIDVLKISQKLLFSEVAFPFSDILLLLCGCF